MFEPFAGKLFYLHHTLAMTSTHVRRPSDVPSERSNADSVSAQEYELPPSMKPFLTLHSYITQQLQLEADAREALPFVSSE